MFRKEGWTQVNPLKPEQFAEIAADFCSRHSFDRPPPKINVVASMAGRNGSSIGASGSGGDPDAMTEEEQLEAALQASMMGDVGFEESGYRHRDDKDDDDDSDVYILEDDDHHHNDDDDNNNHDHKDVKHVNTSNVPITERTGTLNTKNEIKAPSLWDEMTSMVVGNEPPTSTHTARIMIRMPDGKRLVRTFHQDDPVKLIYAFVAQQSMDHVSQGKVFEMKAGFPPKDLMICIDETISSAGLAGESITVRWKEE